MWQPAGQTDTAPHRHRKRFLCIVRQKNNYIVPRVDYVLFEKHAVIKNNGELPRDLYFIFFCFLATSTKLCDLYVPLPASRISTSNKSRACIRSTDAGSVWPKCNRTASLPPRRRLPRCGEDWYRQRALALPSSQASLGETVKPSLTTRCIGAAVVRQTAAPA